MAYRNSRLNRIEDSRAMKTTAWYILLTIGLLILLVLFGIPVISKIASAVVGVVGTPGTQTDSNSPPPPPPQVDAPPAFTKEDKLTFTGKSRPGYTINIFFNDEKTEVLANAQGEFTSILELSDGENTVYAQAVDNSGKTSSDSRKFTVTLDKKPPKVEIISPENGKQIFGASNKHVQIEGQTDPDTRVLINDRIVIVRTDGKFDFPTTLNEGENVFKIKAVDAAGNETESEFKLTFSQ